MHKDNASMLFKLKETTFDLKSCFLDRIVDSGLLFDYMDFPDHYDEHLWSSLLSLISRKRELGVLNEVEKISEHIIQIVFLIMYFSQG